MTYTCIHIYIHLFEVQQVIFVNFWLFEKYQGDVIVQQGDDSQSLCVLVEVCACVRDKETETGSRKMLLCSSAVVASLSMFWVVHVCVRERETGEKNGMCVWERELERWSPFHCVAGCLCGFCWGVCACMCVDERDGNDVIVQQGNALIYLCSCWCVCVWLWVQKISLHQKAVPCSRRSLSATWGGAKREKLVSLHLFRAITVQLLHSRIL